MPPAMPNTPEMNEETMIVAPMRANEKAVISKCAGAVEKGHVPPSS